MAIPVKKSEQTYLDVEASQTIIKPNKEMETIMSTEMKETHTVIRTISATPDRSAGTVGVAEVDNYLNKWLSEGWRILNTHYLGNPPEGWIVAWILVR
jgi:hypothetical protein